VTAGETEGPLAVLLMGYGSPSGPEDLPGYLSEVLHRPPPPELVEEYARRYARIGGSPQNRILASLRSKLERRLARDRPGTTVHLATKHWHPSLREVIPEVARAGHDRLVAVPVTPYASLWITEPYRSGIEEGVRASPVPVEVELRAGWHLDPHWIGYWVRAIREARARLTEGDPPVLLSAHSLPQRMLERGDPYPGLLEATSAAIARAAELARWSFTYQSAGNTTEPWLGPDITERMVGWLAQGARTQLVASFGFVFDHLEVLYDLDVVVREFATAHGIDYHRVPMPNDADEVVEALAARVLKPTAGPAERFRGPGTRSPPASPPRRAPGARSSR
jgi:protoporphyrin/coproporphyrin ferrochelatase